MTVEDMVKLMMPWIRQFSRTWYTPEQQIALAIALEQHAQELRQRAAEQAKSSESDIAGIRLSEF